MSDFRKLGEAIYASPQIGLAELEEAAACGIRLVINNRPDGEAEDQLPGAAIAAKAQALGLAYIAIPVTHAGIAPDQISMMAQALERAAGPVLAYCRTGTRSTLLWALAQAIAGRDPQDIATAAALAGYDLAPVRPAMEVFASQADQRE